MTENPEVKVTTTSSITESQWQNVQSSMQGRMMKSLIGPPGAVTVRDLKLIHQISAKMRDQLLWELPLINAAATTYQDLASTREWAVAGNVLAVPRTVELINNAKTIDPDTGMVYVGFEQYLRRRSLDHITVGRTAFATRNPEDKATFSFEYIDPARLYFYREKIKYGKKDNLAVAVTPDELIWAYGWNGQPTLKHKEVTLNHPIPIGANRFISPLLLVYPTALLAWLLQEHQTASLDGRKLREMFITDAGIRDAVEQGIMQLAALYAGANPADTGIPIIGVSTGNYNKPISDYIARLGISQIPEQFDIKSFNQYYANTIAAAFGLALRQFFNEESTTNRALEDVQEARQQQKGPSAFVRTEQRLINASAVVRILSPRDNPCRFGFIEETDTQSVKDKATATNLLSQGLYNLAQAMGITIAPEYIAQIAQSWNLLPTDVPIAEMLTNAKPLDPNAQATQNSDGKTQGKDEVSTSSDSGSAPQMKSHDPERNMKYDDVLMDGAGRVLAKRVKVYPLADMIKAEIDKQSKNEDLLDPDAISRYDASNEVESLDELVASL